MGFVGVGKAFRAGTVLLSGAEAGAGVPHVMPLFQTVGYEAADLEGLGRAVDDRDLFYVRHRSPNDEAVAQLLVRLERPGAAADEAAAGGPDGAGGIDAALLASGMAAIDAALHAALEAVAARGASAEAGAGASPPVVVTASPLYSATAGLLRALAERGALRLVDCAGGDVGEVAARCAGLAGAGVVIFVEALSNPRLRVADLDGLGALAARIGAVLVVDATFVTPLLCRPLERGAHLVVHSATKYLGGHGDVCAGAVVGEAGLVAAVRAYRRLRGAVLDPFAAWLLHRGLRTLAVRLARQVETAQALAAFLSAEQARLGLTEVIYPGLPSHPDHARAQAVLDAPGAMLSFSVADARAAQRVYEAVRVVRRVASLGDVESLLMYPAGAWRRAMPAAEQARMGIGPGLLRLSVGIEDAADLREDLVQALERARIG